MATDNQQISSGLRMHRNVVMHVNFTGEERLNYVLNNIEKHLRLLIVTEKKHWRFASCVTAPGCIF